MVICRGQEVPTDECNLETVIRRAAYRMVDILINPIGSFPNLAHSQRNKVNIK